MNRIGILFVAVAVLVVGSFFLVEWMAIPVLRDPSVLLDRGGWVAALVGGGLLVGDIVLPVPSSIVMMAHGAVFGVVYGSLLSLVGSVLGAMIGWCLGRRGSGWLERVSTADERDRTRMMLDRYGSVAIVISRMIPVMSETMSVMVGVAGMGWRKVLIPFVLGSIPPAFIYAVAGALAADFSTGLWIAGAVFALAGIAWWINTRRLKSAET